MTNDDYLDELDEGSLMMVIPSPLVKLLIRERTSPSASEELEATRNHIVATALAEARATNWNRPHVRNGDGRVYDHNIQWGTVGLFLGFKRIYRKRSPRRYRVRAISELNPLFFFDGMQVLLSKTELFPVDELPEWFLAAMDIPTEAK